MITPCGAGFPELLKLGGSRLGRWFKSSHEEGVTEALKRQDQMLWVQRMNSIRNRAEESVLPEVIYI
jgi:hypothetical protein